MFNQTQTFIQLFQLLLTLAFIAGIVGFLWLVLVLLLSLGA